MRLFWRKGANAPLDALTEATGLHKPSLYGAFGGKRGLYLAALDAYLADSGSRMAKALSLEPLAAALRAFFDVDLDIFLGSGGQRGCFLMSTALDRAANDPDVRKRVDRAFVGMRSAILARVEKAVAAGDLPPSAERELITDLITSTHVSLSVEARAGRGRSELEAKVHRLLALLCSFR
jgi:AcrR family transcriptional regulator